MEERSVGGKEEKYVLYTVVNDDKSKAGVGVWVVRILLGSLLLVALAVVPYVSLRLAQVNDRTLVVFQPVPIHNHSRLHHHKFTSPSSKTFSYPYGFQSDSLVRENYTTETPKYQKSNNRTNATLVTFHESAVTLSLLEDTDNSTVDSSKNHSSDYSSSLGVESGDELTQTMTINVTSPSTDSADIIKKSDTLEKIQSTETSRLLSSQTFSPVVSSNVMEVDINPTLLIPEGEHVHSTVSGTKAPEPIKSKLLQVLKSSSSSKFTSVESTITTSAPKPRSLQKPGIIHKLAYVATSSSGNHVGGICVWKTNKNVTKWSYFYENIPIEYQSHQDSTDHEMRALLAAVRLWSRYWYDYHVVLRSQHQSVEGSKHPTRNELMQELKKLSEEHFTYETEWRLRADDSLMAIAYCLSRLHKNYDFWFKEFEDHVDVLLGKQDWSKATTENRMEVPQSLFVTSHRPDREKMNAQASLSLL